MQEIEKVKIHTIHHNSHQVLLIHIAKLKDLEKVYLFCNFVSAPEAK